MATGKTVIDSPYRESLLNKTMQDLRVTLNKSPIGRIQNTIKTSANHTTNNANFQNNSVQPKNNNSLFNDLI
jgi:hypothetical protein